MENRSRKQFGPFEFDEGERMLWRDGQPVPLTPKASDLLAAFISQPGRLLSKDELLKTVWPDTFVEESNLAYYVFALRKALEDATGNGRYIETVPNVGTVHRGGLRGGSGHQPDLPPIVQERPSPSFSRRLAIVALVLLAPLLDFGALSWRDLPNADQPRAVPLTSLPGVVRAPSLSPDGNFVVFTWTGKKGGQPRPLCPPGRCRRSAAGDDRPGQRLQPELVARRTDDCLPAAQRRRASQRAVADYGTRRIRAELADVKPLLPSYRPASIAWCHDSRCVLVTDSLGPDKPDALFAVAIDTREKRQLTDPSGVGGDGDPAVSPDGRSVVFMRYTTPFSGRLYRLPMAAGMVPEGPPVQLTRGWVPAKPSWMPDGRESCLRCVADSGSSTHSRADRRRGCRLSARTDTIPSSRGRPTAGCGSLTCATSRTAISGG